MKNADPNLFPRFEFAEAEVAACVLDGDVLSLHFAAAPVQSGVRCEVQWMALQLLASGVQPTQTRSFTGAMGRLHDGQLRWLDDGSCQRHLPLPFSSERACTLALEFAQGERCVFTVRSVQLELVPGRCAVDAYQC
jgi:hypothetical protein